MKGPEIGMIDTLAFRNKEYGVFRELGGLAQLVRVSLLQSKPELPVRR
jgi:hypothetical protein